MLSSNYLFNIRQIETQINLIFKKDCVGSKVLLVTIVFNSIQTQKTSEPTTYQHNSIKDYFMCIIDGEFFLTQEGKIFYKGQVYEAKDCEFMPGSKLIFKMIDEKLDKPIKKVVKMKALKPPPKKEEEDMFILPPDMALNFPSMQVQSPISTHSESPVEPMNDLSQFQDLLKMTGNNLPLTIAIVIALFLYKEKKEKDKKEADHSIACDMDRKDMLRKIDILQSQVNDFEKDQIKIGLTGDDLEERIEKLEKASKH